MKIGGVYVMEKGVMICFIYIIIIDFFFKGKCVMLE